MLSILGPTRGIRQRSQFLTRRFLSSNDTYKKKNREKGNVKNNSATHGQVQSDVMQALRGS